MYIGAYGFNIRVETKLDLTGVTQLRAHVDRPDETSFERLLTDGDIVIIGVATDGIIDIKIKLVGDLNQSGTYKLQIRDETAGRSVYSSIGKFKVSEHIF
jgi:hypothetical protein